MKELAKKIPEMLVKRPIISPWGEIEIWCFGSSYMYVRTKGSKKMLKLYADEYF